MFRGARARLALCVVAGIVLNACNAAEPSAPAQQAAVAGLAPAPSPATLGQSVGSACTSSSAYSAPDVVQSGPNVAGWLLFLAINCPAGSGLTQPLVWETWKPNYAVYLAGGTPPAAWGTPLPQRVLVDQPEIDGHSLLDKSGQPVLNEIRMNRAAFEYVVERQLYSKAAQLRFFADSSSAPVAFPVTAMEIKAAWLILTPGDPRNSRYYIVTSSYVDPSGQSHQVLAGLAGFHITSKVLPQWFWTTFEQVDNQERIQAPATVPISADVTALNDAVHAVLPPDSVWRNYVMRGTQTSFTNAGGAATRLSNTVIETGFQLSSSCITCHGLASRGSATEGSLGFFQMTGTGIQGYMGAIGNRSNQYVDAFGNPVCYDGSRSAFTDCKATNPAIVYKTMDFVWSLREAK